MSDALSQVITPPVHSTADDTDDYVDDVEDEEELNPVLQISFNQSDDSESEDGSDAAGFDFAGELLPGGARGSGAGDSEGVAGPDALGASRWLG